MPNAIYLVAQENSSILQIFVANKTGDGVVHSINECEIRCMIQSELASAPKKNNFYKYLLACLLILFLVLLLFFYWPSRALPGYMIQAASIDRTIVATGQIGAISHIKADADIHGTVVHSKVKQGDLVNIGDVLLHIKSKQIEQQIEEVQSDLDHLHSIKIQNANIDIAKATLQIKQAESEYIRRVKLGRAISREQVDLARTACQIAKRNHEAAVLKLKELALEQRKLERKLQGLEGQFVVRSKVSGQILSRNINKGDTIQPGTSLFTIASDDNTDIKVFLDKEKRSHVNLDQSAQVTLTTHPNQTLAAKIHFISPVINPIDNQFEVGLKLDKQEDGHLLGQARYVSVVIPTAQQDKALIIPNDTFSHVEGNKTHVIVVRDGKVYHQQVTLGERQLSTSEVIAGLKENDQVLINVAKSFQNGEKVRVDLQPYPVK